MKWPWCWHDWIKCGVPPGWLLKDFEYRYCQKCKQYQTKGPPHHAANFWQKIDVPPRNWRNRYGYMEIPDKLMEEER